MISIESIKRERDSDSSEQQVRKKSKISGGDASFANDIEIWLIKKPNNMPDKILKHMDIEKQCWIQQSTSGSFECYKQSIRKPVVILQPEEDLHPEKRSAKNFQPVTAPVRGIIQISHSIHRPEPISPVDTSYKLPRLENLVQRFRPFGVQENKKTQKKKKKQKMEEMP